MDTDFHFTCLNTFGMAGLYGKCILNFVRDCQTVFQNGFTILHSYSNGGEFQRAPMVTVFCFVAVVQSLSHVWLFVTPWTAACQASLSFTISWSLLKFMSIESVTPSNHLILCHSLLLLPSILPSIRVFSNELALLIMWPKYWGFNFIISMVNEYSRLISLGLIGLILLPKGFSRVFSSTTVKKYKFFNVQPSLGSNSHIYTWLLEKP